MALRLLLLFLQIATRTHDLVIRATFAGADDCASRSHEFPIKIRVSLREPLIELLVLLFVHNRIYFDADVLSMAYERVLPVFRYVI